MRLHYVGVNPTKLHDELIAAGVAPRLVESLGADTWVTVQEGQESAVETVVAAHDPLAPTAGEALRAWVLAQAGTAVGVPLANLTTAQRNALLVCMLFRAGGLDPATMMVRSLAEWV